ncbi:MAG TPA: hypothetical protein VN829_10880 [Dongiaceae bacterium]|nr:hypothetical protein [Dongiaceae bacterium]
MQAQAREGSRQVTSATPAVKRRRLIAADILTLGLLQDGWADNIGLPL